MSGRSTTLHYKSEFLECSWNSWSYIIVLSCRFTFFFENNNNNRLQAVSLFSWSVEQNAWTGLFPWYETLLCVYSSCTSHINWLCNFYRTYGRCDSDEEPVFLLPLAMPVVMLRWTVGMKEQLISQFYNLPSLWGVISDKWILV